MFNFLGGLMVFSFGKSKLEVRLGDWSVIWGWRVRLGRALCRIALLVLFVLVPRVPQSLLFP